MTKKKEEKVKQYMVSNSRNWMGVVVAENIIKDGIGSTLFYIGDELVASFPAEYMVLLQLDEKLDNETIASA